MKACRRCTFRPVIAKYGQRPFATAYVRYFNLRASAPPSQLSNLFFGSPTTSYQASVFLSRVTNNQQSFHSCNDCTIIRSSPSGHIIPTTLINVAPKANQSSLDQTFFPHLLIAQRWRPCIPLLHSLSCNSGAIKSRWFGGKVGRACDSFDGCCGHTYFYTLFAWAWAWALGSGVSVSPLCCFFPYLLLFSFFFFFFFPFLIIQQIQMALAARPVTCMYLWRAVCSVCCVCCVWH